MMWMLVLINQAGEPSAWMDSRSLSGLLCMFRTVLLSPNNEWESLYQALEQIAHAPQTERRYDLGMHHNRHAWLLHTY